MGTYVLHEVPTLTYVIKPSAPEDAEAVTLTVRRPDGTRDVFEIGDLDHSATGTYSYDYTPPTAGIYHYGFVSTGPKSAAEGEFLVQQSNV